MKYALFAFRFSGDDDDRESHAPGYLGSDGRDSGDTGGWRWLGDPSAMTLEAAGEVARDGSTDVCTEYSSASVICSCGRLDGEDANSRNAGEVVSISGRGPLLVWCRSKVIDWRQKAVTSMGLFDSHSPSVSSIAASNCLPRPL